MQRRAGAFPHAADDALRSLCAAADRAGLGLGPADGADPRRTFLRRGRFWWGGGQGRARTSESQPRLRVRVGRWVLCWVLSGRFTLLTARGRYSCYWAGYAAPCRRHGGSDGSATRRTRHLSRTRPANHVVFGGVTGGRFKSVLDRRRPTIWSTFGCSGEIIPRQLLGLLARRSDQVATWYASLHASSS